MTRRPFREPREPIFLGCEGSSEHSYGTLISRITSSTKGIKTHVHAENLNPGAGDPVQLVRKAAQKLRDWKDRREPFIFKGVILDCGTDSMNRDAEALAAREGLDLLIWQDPDHEALLLRHFPGCSTLRPPAGTSMAALRKRWPEYEKGIPALKLAQKISLTNILAAAEVEPGLQMLLRKIGLLSS